MDDVQASPLHVVVSLPKQQHPPAPVVSKKSLRWLSWNMKAGQSRPFWVKSKFVGLSCFLYLIPASCYYTLWARISSEIYAHFVACLCIALGLVTVVSFLADYIHIPVMTSEEVREWFDNPASQSKYPPSVWGRRDRLISGIAAIFAWVECCIRIGLISSTVATGLCLASINHSRNSGSTRSWVLRHSMWHFTSSAVLCLAALL